MIIILWGVSGCGKTTVGELLAARLTGVFYDADDYHPTANIEKMSAGIPLEDDDRWPWLEKVAEVVAKASEQHQHVLLACSALKQSYREILATSGSNVLFIHLSGSFELIAQRLVERNHQFMNPNLLQSQFDSLELAVDGLTVDITHEPVALCEQIVALLEG